MMSVQTYLLGLAAMAYVVASVIVGTVRWFHMCRPYDEHPDYYYPGRISFFHFALSTLVLIPYIVSPESTDAWYLAKTFFFPVFLFYLNKLMFSYFGSVMHWQKWKKSLRILGYPVFSCLTVVLIFSLLPGNQIGEGGLVSCKTVDIVLIVLGSFETLISINSFLMVWKWAQSFDEDDYSNPGDFPVRFALRMIMLFVFNICLLWANMLIGAPAVMAVLMIFLAAFETLFLIYVLHPQRTREFVEPIVEEEHKEEPAVAHEEARQGYLQGLTKEKEAEILYAIQAVVVEQEAYLDPHITLQDIANRCGYSRTYVAGLLKSELGGFFAYINTLRLEHAEAYERLHPEATMQEVATESGFSSRQTYHAVKSRLTAKNEQ